MKKVFLILFLVVFIHDLPTLVLAAPASEPPSVTNIENIYPSQYLPGFSLFSKLGFGYFLKTVKDQIGLFLTFDQKEKNNRKLTIYLKKMMEIQSLAELRKCSQVSQALKSYNDAKEELFRIVHTARENNEDITLLVTRIYRVFSLPKAISRRVAFFCPLDGKNFDKIQNQLIDEAENYWGIKQLKEFHQNKIEEKI